MSPYRLVTNREWAICLVPRRGSARDSQAAQQRSATQPCGRNRYKSALGSSRCQVGPRLLHRELNGRPEGHNLRLIDGDFRVGLEEVGELGTDE